jgi:predicted phosphohydrolase
MKIQVLSDLHQEFGVPQITFEGADLVLMAGDINLGTKGIEWIKSAIDKLPVIYVVGNHEYYKGSYPKTLNQIREFAYETNVYVLENDIVVMDDITFHGATLWTDFALMVGSCQTS